VTANSGYIVNSVTGCGGSLSGNTYTTGTINAACTVTANFLASSPPPPAPAEFSLSTNTLSFVAHERFAAPTPQAVGATVNVTTSGTLYILAKVSGQAVELVEGFTVTGTTAANGWVHANSPATLGPGTYQGTVTVTACMNSPDCSSGQLRGSPQTINVNYTVENGSVQGQLVMPRIAVSNTSGDVIIRAAHFTGATSVSFGSAPAAAFSVVSDTEIHATFPPLPAGDYPITINNGAVAFSASMAVVDPQSYPATALAYPAPAPAPFTGMVGTPKYDAVRKTIYVVLKSSQPQNNRLVSYTYANGAWGAPQQAVIANLLDIMPGPTGDYLLGPAGQSVLEIDPTTLAVRNTHTLNDALHMPLNNFFISSLALTNDGYGIVTTGCSSCSGLMPIYMFSTQNHSFQVVQPDFIQSPAELDAGVYTPTAQTSADGSTALIGGLYTYQPSTSLVSSVPFVLQPPVEMDTRGTRVSLSDAPGLSTDIYDAQLQRLGRISEPASNTSDGDMASAVSPDGKLVYVLRYDFSQNAAVALLTYDISSSTPVTSFPQIGTEVPLPPMMMGGGYSFGLAVATVTPDGKTLLVGADNNLFVQPLP
jgi:hypothetical protein